MTTSRVEDEVKLLGTRLSPYVIRVRLALKLKGIECEFLEEVLKNKSELLLESNPVHKKVPVLIHEGKPICESMIIVEYIDEAWATRGPSVLPSDPFHRATARFWARYIDDKFFPSVIVILKTKSEEAKREAIAQFVASLQILEAAFEKCSDGKPFFGGDSIGYVDVALGCFLGWIATAEELNGCSLYDRAKVPNLTGWGNRFLDDDAVKNVMPETQECVAHGKMLWHSDATK